MPTDPPALEVLFTPAECAALPGRDLSGTACVVFDIFRATSTILTAFANGATAIIPVAEIPEALALKREQPGVLLAGERHGLRIRGDLTGGVDFDLGNSPREFTRGRVADRSIVLSTTNGSRALRACAGAQALYVASFLNLAATAKHLQSHAAGQVLLVCSGTGAEAAYEDVVAAGALASLIWPADGRRITDSARIARHIYELHRDDLMTLVPHSRNGRQLSEIPELKDDVPLCLRRDVMPIVATLRDGKIMLIG